MKKRTVAVMMALALTLTPFLAGCQTNPASSGETPPQSVESQSPAANWGITLSVKDVTETGLTLVIAQEGGEPTGELYYGSDYFLERLNDGTWEEMPYATDEDLITWTSEAYAVLMGDAAEKSIVWDHVYGSLPAGTYRIGKTFMDFRASGDFDEETYYSGFEIK